MGECSRAVGGGTGWVTGRGPSSPMGSSSALGGSGWRGVFAPQAAVPVSPGKAAIPGVHQPSPAPGYGPEGPYGPHLVSQGGCDSSQGSGGGCGRCCAGGRSSRDGSRQQPQPRIRARTLLMGRTRLFRLQADKGHLFPFLPPGFALRVLKLVFFHYLLTPVTFPLPS